MCAVLAAADTIHLKNGRTIVADRVTEKNGRVYYEIGDNSYGIPKTLVESIETAPVESAPTGQPSPPSAALSPAQPAFKLPELDLPAAARLVPRVIRDGRVDPDMLAAIERAGHVDVTAAAFFVAGRHEFERGDRDRARFYYDRALMFAPRNPVLLGHYAAVLVQLGRPAEAIPYAERAARIAPASADAFSVLGFAYYRSDRVNEAVKTWKRALQLRPDEALAKLLGRAEREAQTEAGFVESESGHFSFHYEGSSTSPELRAAITAALEQAYNDLVRELGVVPQAAVSISLYTDRAFFDVTQAPAWSGAMNDGKLRIPVQGVTTVTPELVRVLRHELAHSFINQAARGRCPQWLNEGIAQLIEPRSIGQDRGTRLAELFRTGRQIPLNTMEASFLTFSPFEALLAYDESLAAAEYIRDTYGMSELTRILSRIGDGSSTETALRISLHSGYAGLEQVVARYLLAKYGPS